jgi:hypothetical protein
MLLGSGLTYVCAGEVGPGLGQVQTGDGQDEHHDVPGRAVADIEKPAAGHHDGADDPGGCECPNSPARVTLASVPAIFG